MRPTLLICALMATAPTLTACKATAVSEVQAVDVADEGVASDLAGRWTGELDVRVATLRLDLVLEAEGDGLSGQLISVDQGNAVIPLDTVSLDGAAFRFDASAIGASYEGVTTSDGTIEGSFTQRGQSFELTFERVAADAEASAPEARQPTEPDTLVAVTHPETGAIHQLAGTLTQPEEGARAGVVILSGSGSQDRNGTIAGQPLYAAWAELLAEQGVASLRLDDRGVGGSDAVIPASPDDLALDAASALEVLRLETGLECVGFVGHSEGGWVGLLAGPSADADFVVSMAGMHERMETTLIRQSEAIIRASGGGRAAVAANRRLQEAVFSVLRVAGPDDNISGQIEDALTGAGAPSDLAQSQAAIWGQPYAAASFQMDPGEAAAAYAGPVLALFGETDTQVLAGPNAQALLASRPNAQTRTVTVEGVDHLFQINETGAPGNYGSAGHAIAPGAAQVFADEVRTLLDQACAG